MPTSSNFALKQLFQEENSLDSQAFVEIVSSMPCDICNQHRATRIGKAKFEFLCQLCKVQILCYPISWLFHTFNQFLSCVRKGDGLNQISQTQFERQSHLVKKMVQTSGGGRVCAKKLEIVYDLTNQKLVDYYEETKANFQFVLRLKRIILAEKDTTLLRSHICCLTKFYGTSKLCRSEIVNWEQLQAFTNNILANLSKQSTALRPIYAWSLLTLISIVLFYWLSGYIQFNVSFLGSKNSSKVNQSDSQTINNNQTEKVAFQKIRQQFKGKLQAQQALIQLYQENQKKLQERLGILERKAQSQQKLIKQFSTQLEQLQSQKRLFILKAQAELQVCFNDENDLFRDQLRQVLKYLANYKNKQLWLTTKLQQSIKDTKGCRQWQNVEINRYLSKEHKSLEQQLESFKQQMQQIMVVLAKEWQSYALLPKLIDKLTELSRILNQ